LRPNIVNPRLIYALINWVHLHQFVSRSWGRAPGPRSFVLIDPAIHRYKVGGSSWSFGVKTLEIIANWIIAENILKITIFCAATHSNWWLDWSSCLDVLIKGAPLLLFLAPLPSAAVSFSPQDIRLFRGAALDEIKLNKFYNTFAPAHSPLTWPLDWNAISLWFFRFSFTNDDDADDEDRVYIWVESGGSGELPRRLLAHLTSLTYNNKLNCSWPTMYVVSCSYISV